MHIQEEEKEGRALGETLLEDVDLAAQRLAWEHVLEDIRVFCTWGNKVTIRGMIWGIKKRVYCTS